MDLEQGDFVFYRVSSPGVVLLTLRDKDGRRRVEVPTPIFPPMTRGVFWSRGDRQQVRVLFDRKDLLPHVVEYAENEYFSVGSQERLLFRKRTGSSNVVAHHVRSENLSTNYQGCMPLPPKLTTEHM